MGAAVLAEIPFSAEMLEALDASIAIAAPILVEGEIVDVEIVWMTSRLRDQARRGGVTHRRLSEIYPELYDGGWLEELVIARKTGRPSTRFRPNRLDGGELDVTEVTVRWAGDWLVATARNLSTRAGSNADVIRAAAMLSEMMASNPVFARLVLPHQTLEFSTRAWVEERGGVDSALDDMIVESDRNRVAAWLALPPSQREPSLVFRAHHLPGVEHWYSIRTERIADSGLEVQIVADVDHYVRANRASERLARDLHGQLDVLTRALDASAEGFAIWRAQRAENGEIETYILEFMNTAGAEPTGMAPDTLINRSIEDVVGGEEAANLSRLFTQVLVEDDSVTETLTVETPAGWVGAFENRISPIGHDCVVASFRPVH